MKTRKSFIKALVVVIFIYILISPYLPDHPSRELTPEMEEQVNRYVDANSLEERIKIIWDVVGY